MEYRTNKRTGDKISTLGFGTSYIAQANEADAVATIRRAYEGGVNYFDLATAEGRTFPYFGTALGDMRKYEFGRERYCNELSILRSRNDTGQSVQLWGIMVAERIASPPSE